MEVSVGCQPSWDVYVASWCRPYFG